MPEETKPYNPLISVIIPCHNGAKYLSQTLNSVLKQSYSTWECIVADDGSTDNSKDIVLEYTNRDSRFRYVYQPNAGPSAARNMGIKVSKGDFFQFIDSDDLIEINKLKRQMEVFERFPSSDIVYGNMKYFSITPGGQIKTRDNDDKYWKNAKISGAGNEIIKVLLHENIMVVDSPLIRRTVFEKIGLWDEQIWFNEDWDVWTRCAFSGLSFQYDDTVDTDALVRDHEDSRSRDLSKMYLHGLKVCLKINRVITNWEYKKIIRPKIYHHLRFLEQDILSKYKTDKPGSLEKASQLYLETNLFHCRIFVWLIQNTPYSFSSAYSRFVYLFNRLKCKLFYES